MAITFDPNSAPHCMGAWDNALHRLTERDFDHGARAAEKAQEETMPAKKAIRAIRVINEREIAELLSCIQARVAESGWSHTDAAVQVGELLTDAIWHLETQASKDE